MRIVVNLSRYIMVRVSLFQGVVKCLTHLKHSQKNDITALVNLVNLDWLNIGANQTSEIRPLMENQGLSAGITIWLRENLLNLDSITKYMPELQLGGSAGYLLNLS